MSFSVETLEQLVKMQPDEFALSSLLREYGRRGTHLKAIHLCLSYPSPLKENCLFSYLYPLLCKNLIQSNWRDKSYSLSGYHLKNPLNTLIITEGNSTIEIDVHPLQCYSRQIRYALGDLTLNSCIPKSFVNYAETKDILDLLKEPKLLISRRFELPEIGVKHREEILYQRICNRIVYVVEEEFHGMKRVMSGITQEFKRLDLQMVQDYLIYPFKTRGSTDKITEIILKAYLGIPLGVEKEV